MQGLTSVGSQLCNTFVGSLNLLLKACKAFPSEFVERAGEMKRKKERMREIGAIREIANVKWEIRRKKISKVFMNIKSRPKREIEK